MTFVFLFRSTNDINNRNFVFQILYSICVLIFEIIFCFKFQIIFLNQNFTQLMNEINQRLNHSLFIFSTYFLRNLNVRHRFDLLVVQFQISIEIIVFSQFLIYRHAHIVFSNHVNNFI